MVSERREVLRGVRLQLVREFSYFVGEMLGFVEGVVIVFCLGEWLVKL